MRFTASEKLEIIRLVEQSDLGVKLTLNQLYIPKSTFYDWYGRDQEVLARRDIIKQRTLLKRKLDFELKKTALI